MSVRLSVTAFDIGRYCVKTAKRINEIYKRHRSIHKNQFNAKFNYNDVDLRSARTGQEIVYDKRSIVGLAPCCAIKDRSSCHGLS